MEAAVELAQPRLVGLGVHLGDDPARRGEIRRLQQRQGQAQRRRLERRPDRVVIGGVGRRDLGHHRAAMGKEIDQRLGLELAQRLAHRLAADAEGGGELLLAQRHAAGQRAAEDALAQRAFDILGRRPVARQGGADERGERRAGGDWHERIVACRLDPIEL